MVRSTPGCRVSPAEDGSIKFTVTLTVPLAEALKTRADVDGESMQTVVRQALRVYLEVL